MLDIPCSQYEIPPPECADESEGDGSYQNDSYYDSQNFPYPARFNFVGMINGYPVVGTAFRAGVGSAYNASFDAVDGSDCYGNLVIDLSWFEAVTIELGNSTILSSWRTVSSFFCD
jgi:hypothetical protein